ncbi:LOW QUALITY PROTEIN: tyrosine-protein kinase receptor UFO [Sardina pilchardus]|uniref:LOW QUALITY PROTEIN: tyrosine-protein kinase receptor UFO n=1 Tax=Sardina pilchardus TaxID=27697 RepID=UPI002E15AC4B
MMTTGAKITLLLFTFSLHALNIATAETWTGLRFVQSPTNLTSSLGKPVKLQCHLQGQGGDDSPPDVIWFQGEVMLEMADTNQIQLQVDEDTWVVMSTLRIEAVQLADMGAYRCAVMDGEELTLSYKGHIQLEGLPHFSVEPQPMSVVANESVSLLCVAHGPPEPVHIIWLQDGAPLNTLDDPMSRSPSYLNLTGLNRTSSFSCEAHNRKGVASSGSGTVTVLPAQPRNIRASETTNSSLHVTWEPGFGGVYPITRCSVQARIPGDDPDSAPGELVHNQNVNVNPPPAALSLGQLEPFSQYQVRVACHSSQGVSDWSPWVSLHTAEGVPSGCPVNVTAVINGSSVILKWAEPEGPINGHLLGYRMEYRTPNSTWELHDSGLDTELSVNVTETLSNISFRVCAYTGAGQGPWSPVQTLALLQPEVGNLQSRENAPAAFSWHWWYVVMAIAVAVALAVLMAIYVARLRRKETRFGEAFEPMMESGELVVRYRARRTYSRRTTEATLNTLGISDELKQKLQDVMVDRHKLTLGKTLGEGEFGSVMEGLLTQEDSVLKVAVKTMKIAICTRTEMEDFLREAACMKEFDHQNVMRLVGVCLQTVESEGYPSPVVILPYMKHGDLHSYLLYSRLGDCPVYLPSQMLVKFMTDIARGMEYLSSKNFIHRDLAARNCMLNENMNVCVADFGLSKKIYNGDYYRQGRISKMPVKWIAIESLADRVYTTKSDVWSFGVTMWEIATRGQTPYPGVENSEIYDYLRQGNRLKQPPDCLDSIYSLMFSCWFLSPKDRPSFEVLCCELEKVLEELPDPQDPDEILYVNMEESSSGEMGMGAVGGRDPTCPLGGLMRGGMMSGLALPLPPMKDSVATVEVHAPHQPNRYVLCPQHEMTTTSSAALSSSSAALAHPPRPLLPAADSLESLQLPAGLGGGLHSATCSSSASPTPTLQLQPSERSSPVPPLDATDDDDDHDSMHMGPAAVRRVPWQ